MHHTKLGRTGLRVSKLCLGTMTFGLQCDEAQSTPILDAAAAGGIDFLDTADVYPLGGGHNTAGRTEEIVGDWLEGKRHDFIVATKCVGADGPQAVGPGHVAQAHPRRDRRLARGASAPTMSISTSCTATTRTRRSTRRWRRSTRSCRTGKARYVGVSNWPAYKVARALGRSEVRNIARIDSVQPRYNLLFRSFERDLLPLCAEEGDRGDPLQSAGRRAAHRQARPQGAAAGRLALPARHRRRALPGALLARARVRDHRGAAPGRRGGGHEHGDAGGALGAGQPGDHRADRRRQPARAARRQPGGRREGRAAARSQDTARRDHATAGGRSMPNARLGGRFN